MSRAGRGKSFSIVAIPILYPHQSPVKNRLCLR
ncbi:unnamed protein product [Acanthoscelides obtectus]|uniref:Uncharacterized protein n=1 Tax=Acanthoscelides obtectus TaxID=200917 RepID=A0A9P0L7P1_ACAOB|nr:unnamed protein product [Acanthoscelides obtectus]CAK1634064.1 hypothetical protein AOBTE_LOCUS8575 [Acanthoscelides obtectus]